MMLLNKVMLLLAVTGLGLGCARTDDDGDEAVEAPSRLVAGERGEALVQLDTAELRRLDLLTVPLSEARWGGTRELIGELVVDPARSSTVRSAVAGLLVAERWPEFGAAVQAGELLGTVGDARPLTAARSGRVVAVLAQPGELVQAGQALLELADLDHPVARLVWFGESGPQPPRDVQVRSDGGPLVSARLMGPSPTVDSVTRRPAFLYRATRAWPGARPGMPVVATFGGGFDAIRGVQVPADAVVQWDGFTWVYLERSSGVFYRQRIETDRPLEGAWFVSSGLKPGDGVVVRGAQAILSEEFRARISVGDESDK